MLTFLLSCFLIFSQANAANTRCDRSQSCHLTNDAKTIICDSAFGGPNDTTPYPIISCFPPVNAYVFRNFQRLQAHIFRNVSFPENEPIAIKLINIQQIETEAFSSSMKIPESSKLTFEIGHSNGTSGITIHPFAFHHLTIDRLSFFNISVFNGRPVFETNSFGSELTIDQLTFEQCGITGFMNGLRRSTHVNQLSIKHCPALTQLTDKSLPSFLSVTKTLEVSDTSLSIINSNTFHAWSLALEQLIISNNSKLEYFPPSIIDGKFAHLETLDLSYNSIKTFGPTSSWSSYSSVKRLLLKKQQIDLFLKTNILQTLTQLEQVDLSEGFIVDNNDDMLKHFQNMTNLNTLDVSYTNLSEKMIIDLLMSISQVAKQFVTIRLYGHSLTDANLCSYFKIFKNAPDLLHLILDESHVCNCVIDLFYMNNLREHTANYSSLKPICLFNTSRTACNIDAELSTLKCNVGTQSTDESDSNNKIGNYAFGAVVAGLVIVVLVLVLLGFSVVYRIRRRRNTDLDMEQPVENPLAAVIEQRSHNK